VVSGWGSCQFFFFGATPPIGPELAHSRGFLLELQNTDQKVVSELSLLRRSVLQIHNYNHASLNDGDTF